MARTVEDAEDRLAALKPERGKLRQLVAVSIIAGMGLLALLVHQAVTVNILFAAVLLLLMVGFGGLPIALVVMDLLRRARIEREALEAWLETGEGDPYDPALAGFHR